MTRIDDGIAVALAHDGRPGHLIWRARHFRVSDTPTRLLDDPFLDAAFTHPPAPPPGWRVQGTDDDGETRMFDIRLDATRAGWVLMRVYT